jgi:ATP-dependent Zn protease
MVTRWGMSDLIGPVAVRGENKISSWGEVIEKEYSEDLALKIDKEIISKLGSIAASNGGLRIVTGTLNSPSLNKALTVFKTK